VAIIDALNAGNDVVKHPLADVRMDAEADEIGAGRAPQIMYNKIRRCRGLAHLRRCSAGRLCPVTRSSASGQI